MNLIDAIKSGRPFRRNGWGNVALGGGWAICKRDWVLEYADKRDRDANHGYPPRMTGEDYIADDWETLEPTVTITRTQLNDVLLVELRKREGAWSFDSLIRDVARKLGLEP